MNYSRDSRELLYIASTLKLDQPYKPEEMYIKDVSIKDKNELINSINKIYSDINISCETMEYIYSNNFQFINQGQNNFSGWSKSEILNRLGKNSALFQKSTSLYYNLLSTIQNNGKEIKQVNEINEDVEMKVEENDLKEKDVKEIKLNVNSLCDDFEQALKEYNAMKKEKEKEEVKKKEENKSENKKDKTKKVLVDKEVMVFEDEGTCLEKLNKFEGLF